MRKIRSTWNTHFGGENCRKLCENCFNTIIGVTFFFEKHHSLWWFIYDDFQQQQNVWKLIIRVEIVCDNDQGRLPNVDKFLIPCFPVPASNRYYHSCFNGINRNVFCYDIVMTYFVLRDLYILWWHLFSPFTIVSADLDVGIKKGLHSRDDHKCPAKTKKNSKCYCVDAKSIDVMNFISFCECEWIFCCCLLLFVDVVVVVVPWIPITFTTS